MAELGDLTARLQANARGLAAQPETLAHFRRTLSRVAAQQRLARSLAKLPDNAGPLNSHQLVHRALETMRALSPAYFEHFGAYLDALLAVEQVDLQHEAAVAAARKTSRGKR